MKILLLLVISVSVFADEFADTKKAITQMSGCFLVDYSYSETERIKRDYVMDTRVYDVNKDKSVKEWIYPVELSDRKIRLQHVLFLVNLKGEVVSDSFLKHPSDDWEFEPDFVYEFLGPNHWSPKKVSDKNVWVRKVTHLDDGLRYQCAASWKFSAQGYPEWTCSNYAPIPGRESRDMHRKDYQTLSRKTRLVLYGNNFLERQENVKTVHKDGVKTPLVREVGKNWYVRLKDEECKEAQEWVKPQLPFWSLLQKTWDEVLTGKEDFKEQIPKGSLPRFLAMAAVQKKYQDKIEKDPEEYSKAKKEILEVIEKYRVR